MLFWIVAAILTLAACLAVLLPVVRERRSGPADADFDLEVYRDQLAELDRDAARGVIDRAEAGQARAEIARRILKAAGMGAPAPRAASGRFARAAATLAILAVPVASWGIYAATGSPHLPAMPLEARLKANPAESTMAELVARAEAHLTNNPQDGRGWEVLAPIYVRAGRFEDAAAAYRNAIRLLGSTAPRETGLGEAIAAAAGGVIVDEAREALTRALTLDADYPKARFLLATGLAQQGRTQEAAAAWQAMRDALDPASPWREAAIQALARLERDARPGPTAEDIEAAGLTSDNDRAAMIDNMVASLDARLRENPDDPEGWQRLVQSYLVLDRPSDAADALARGLAALGAGSGPGRELAAFAAERGVKMTE